MFVKSLVFYTNISLLQVFPYCKMKILSAIFVKVRRKKIRMRFVSYVVAIDARYSDIYFHFSFSVHDKHGCIIYHFDFQILSFSNFDLSFLTLFNIIWWHVNSPIQTCGNQSNIYPKFEYFLQLSLAAFNIFCMNPKRFWNERTGEDQSIFPPRHSG